MVRHRSEFIQQSGFDKRDSMVWGGTFMSPPVAYFRFDS
jgi:hypothetical protein